MKSKVPQLHLDYNTIADSAKELLPDLYEYELEGVAIEVNGGSMLGMHLAHLLNLPYSFITYHPQTIEPLWLGAPLRTKRILVVTDYASESALHIKTMLDKEGYEVYFFSIYQDEISKVQSDFLIYDNTGMYQEVVVPWRQDFVPPEVEYLDTSIDGTSTSDVRKANLRFNKQEDLSELIGPTYWFLTKRNIPNANINLSEDEMLILDSTTKPPLEKEALAKRIGVAIRKEKFRNIVVEDMTNSIVVASMYPEANIYLLVSSTLIRVKAKAVKQKPNDLSKSITSPTQNRQLTQHLTKGYSNVTTFHEEVH